MAERRMRIIALCLCFCLCLVPYTVRAASASDVVELIEPEQECELTISCLYGGTAFSGLFVKLYRVAEVSADLRYTLTASFARTELALNGVQTNGEWNVIRTTLEAQILGLGIAEDTTAVTDEGGQAYFGHLKTGLYLAVIERGEEGSAICDFTSALIALPGLGANGRWQYAVTVSPKAVPVSPTDKELSYKIVKLWKNETERAARPHNVEVEIFRDGVSYQKVTLSEENNWSFSWVATDDGTDWSVVERNIPLEYSMTVEERETTFVMTNAFLGGEVGPGGTDLPPDSPSSGDTTNIMLYILLSMGSGAVLLLVGVGKRKRL